MDIIGNANVWLENIRHEKLTNTVTYVQNGVSYPDLLATRGRTQFEEINNDGNVVAFTSSDFIFRVQDLAFKPKEGDKIIEQVGNEQITYEVKSLGNKRCYTVDNYRLSYRVSSMMQKEAVINLFEQLYFDDAETMVAFFDDAETVHFEVRL